MDRPNVLIMTGLGFNSHAELGRCYEHAGAHVDFMHFLELLEKIDILDRYNGLGGPGGFTGGDHLGAGMLIANLTRANPKAMAKLEEKLDDPDFPVALICNSVQYAAKLDQYPVRVGTLPNDTGVHMTNFWDLAPDPKCDSCWLDYIRYTKEPIIAPISHGEGRFYLDADGLAKAKEMGLIAMRYVKGDMYNRFIHSRGDIYNPNGSTDDIAALSWRNNIAIFPHLERLQRNVQRPDRHEFMEKGGDVHGFYEPTMLFFKGAVDFMRTRMR